MGYISLSQEDNVMKQSSFWDLFAGRGRWASTSKGKPIYDGHVESAVEPVKREALETFEVNFADTTIEVAQLQTKGKRTLVLYLTSKGQDVEGQDLGRQDSEVVFWECASHKLKQIALKHAFDPLHLLRRFEEQVTQQLKQPMEITTRQSGACCSTCFSCSLQAVS
jgi:hypothetical protein